MWKRLLSLCTALALCLSLLPVTALAAAPNGQVIYVGNVNVTNGGYWTIDSDGNVTASTAGDTLTENYIHYDAGDNTLTLHNATIKKGLDYNESIQGGTYILGSAIGVFNQNGDAELTITLEGTNTIEDVSTGIFVLAHSPSTGDATLTITGSGSLDASGILNGILVQSNGGDATLTIQSADVTLTSNSGNGVTVQAGSTNSSGEHTITLSVEGGSLTASGSTGISFDSASSYTVSATNLTVSNNAIVRANDVGSNISNVDLQIGKGNNSSGGIVFDGNQGTVYGSVELQDNLTIDDDENLTIGEDASLTIPNNITLTNEGTVTTDGGTLTNNGTINNSGTLPDDIDGTAPPSITTTSLAGGTVGTAYTATLAASGTGTITWSNSGNLPAGLTLDENTGVISGTPTADGTFNFTAKATNDGGSDSKELSITIGEQTNVPVNRVSLNKTSTTLTVGGTETLTATVAPDNATDKTVTWTSSNPSVATVENGVVTAVAPGTAVITVTTQDGNKTATCTVTVTARTYNISVAPDRLDFSSVNVGYEIPPTAQTVTITNTGNQSVTVNLPTSTNYTITAGAGFTNGTASLALNGTAQFTVQPKTGLGVGTYRETITVSGSNGASASLTASFTVNAIPVTSVTLSQTQASLYCNRTPNTITLTATVAPDNATNQAVTWTSSDSTVATVDQNGVVTAVAPGTAVITAAAADGSGASASCTVTVSRYSSGGGSSSSSTSLSDRAIDDIQDARPGDTVEITLRPGRTTLEREVFEELAGQDITLEIDAGDGVLWTVNGLDIPEDTRLHDLDLDVDLGDSDIPATVLNAVTGEIDTVQLSLAHDGRFGFTMTLSAPLGRDNADYWANLYWYNERTEELEFQQAARIARDGTAEFDLDHASDYAIVIDDRSHEPVDLPFNDVPEGYWAYDAIQYVYGEGLMAGTSGSTFSPEGTTTRGQIVTILWRLSGSPVVNYLMDFDDVDPAAYYAEAIRWASSEGIAGGYGNGSFGPDDPITREQLAVMLYQYAWNMGYDLSIGEDTNILSYADAFTVSEYAVSALQWACGAGIISGTGDGSTLTPQGEATRAQAATVLMRFCELQ